MLDLRYVTQNLEEVVKGLSRRGPGVDLSGIEGLAKQRRDLITANERARHEQKEESQRLGKLMKENPAEGELLRAKLKTLSEKVKAGDQEVTQLEEQLQSLLMNTPNIPHASVPTGTSEHDNQLVRYGRLPKPDLAFQPKSHWDLGESLGILDWERAAKVSGARFTFYFGAAAQLERALVSFMLDTHTSRGYREVLPPFLVNRASMTGTGQLPKFEQDAFKTMGEHELFLIPTAEVPVTNLYRDEILDGAKLPISYAAFSPCFRAEAGAAGKDTRGLIRQHQFEKVELVKFVKPEDSYAEHEKLTNDACEILELLGLHYRVMLLCSGDMGANSAKTYDLEVWLPGQNTYREISSCSNFEDYQARRAQIRFRPSATEKAKLVHTLNGSGLAVGRTVVAVLENYQQADGSVLVPEVLRPYMRNRERITAEG
jgi:seryl-tRNA synthetase